MCFFIFSCKEEAKKTETIETAETIVNKAIENAGGSLFENTEMSFVFRDILYKSKQENGAYSLERIIKNSEVNIHDVLTNNGFVRKMNDRVVKLPDSMIAKYSNSINSVHYFLRLPYGLNAEAVQKKLVGEDTINGEVYYEIEVHFIKDGGGTDFNDVFMYWIHKENYTVDFLAYSYETNGGGIRFREAYNVRVVNGIRFADYYNYKPNLLSVKLKNLDSLFQNNELIKVSKIETSTISVTPLNLQ